MKYNIDKIRASTGDRVSTTTDLNEVTEAWFDGFSVEVTDNLSSNVYKFCNWDDWCEYADSEARNLQWMDRELKTKLTEDLLEIEQAELRKIEAAVSPSHYKGFVGELQWLEAQQYIIGERKGPEAFKAAVELQIRKYLDRNGGKDSEVQELLKAKWYMDFLCAYALNGDKPIRIKEIPKILQR